MKKILFTIIGGFIFVSCSQKTVEPVTTAEPKVYKSEDIAQGKLLYTEHCIKCHKAFAPSDFTEKKWRHEVAEMAVKAKIDSEKENLILIYVLAGAKK